MSANRAPSGRARPLRPSMELGPRDVRVDGQVAREGREAAAAGGHQVLTTDQLAVAHEPLSDRLRVLDEFVFESMTPGMTTLPSGTFFLEDGPLVLVARVGALEQDRGHALGIL